MMNVQKTREPIENALVKTILSYAETQKLSREELAKELGIVPSYLAALIFGDRRIDDREVRFYRKVASVLGMSCFSTMLLAGALTAEDFSVAELATVSAEEKAREWINNANDSSRKA